MKNFWNNLIDSETLMLLSVMIFFCIEPSVREIIAGGILGYIGKQVKETPPYKQ